MIDLFVSGIPKGQPRPRAFAVAGKARVYDPSTAEVWKSAIASAIQPHLPAAPLDGPLRINLVFLMPRPKSHYRTGKFSRLLKKRAPRYHAGKPDIDNLTKAALDALKTIGLYRDDRQVSSGFMEKEYADDGCQGCRIMIARIG